jgi:hypothetical protein
MVALQRMYDIQARSIQAQGLNVAKHGPEMSN